MSAVKTKLTSFGHYLPKRVVPNTELEKYMETSDEWIQQRSGIKERRWVTEGETTLSMATEASKMALDKAGVTADDVDAIIFSALVTDHIFPGTGCLLQESLGCKNPIPALDIRNQCSAFLYSLSIADAWIRSGMYKRVLITASEIHSTSLDISDRGRDIAVLFGDGAASCLVEATEEENCGVIDTMIASEGKNAEKLFIGKPSSNDHPRLSPKTEIGRDFFPYMDGKFVFKNAIYRMTESMHQILKRNDFTPGDVDFVVAHQANMRINHMVLEQLEIPIEKTHHTIEFAGNTTAATIPLTLGDAVEKGKVKRGDLVALTAFGSGFTWGSSLLRY